MPHSKDIWEDAEKCRTGYYCSRCAHADPNKLPRGKWPCTTCSSNSLYKGFLKDKHGYKDHYTAKESELIPYEI